MFVTGRNKRAIEVHFHANNDLNTLMLPHRGRQKTIMQHYKATIIVPAYNESRYIEKFLDNLENQNIRAQDVEVLIADGGSTDGTVSKIRSYKSRFSLKLIHNAGKIVSTGLNLCLAKSSGEIIVRMDVHTRYDPNYVSECISCLQKTDADCVGGAWAIDMTSIKIDPIKIAFMSKVGSGAANSRDTSYEGPTDTVYLGAWKSDYLKKIGGFDESLIRNQDDELCLRIRQAGGIIYQSPKIISFYTPRSQYVKLWQQFFQYGYWRPVVMKKHNRAGALRQYIPALLILLILSILICSIFFPKFLQVLFLYPFSVLIALLFEWRSKVDLGLVFGATMAVIIMHLAYGIGFIWYIVGGKHKNFLSHTR